MKTRRQRNLDDFNRKRSLKRHKASNRFFLDQDTMGEARWAEAIEHSRAKKEGKKLVGVHMGVFHCPCACLSPYPKYDVGAALPPKQPKSQRKPAPPSKGNCVHFRGKVTSKS